MSLSKRPALQAGQFEYEWAFDEEGNTATCVLDFHPAEVFSGKLHTASCSLRAAYIGDTSIYALLSGGQELRIEKLALAAMERSIREQADEARINRSRACEDAYV